MEKTFEELIEEHQWFERSDYAKKEPLLDKIDVLKLLQQVREATIEECREKSIEFWGDIDKNNINYYINKIKTDRIKSK